MFHTTPQRINIESIASAYAAGDVNALSTIGELLMSLFGRYQSEVIITIVNNAGEEMDQSVSAAELISLLHRAGVH